MNVKKMVWLKSMFVVVAGLSFLSCVNTEVVRKICFSNFNDTQVVVQKSLKSFVFIATTFTIETSPGTEVTARGRCSGTIVKNTPGGSYVLTANHCGELDLKKNPLLTGKVLAQTTTVTDYDYVERPAEIFKMNKDNDIMLFFVPKLTKFPAIPLGIAEPEKAEIILNIAAPGGFYPTGGVAIILSGRYSGKFNTKNLLGTLSVDFSVYSIDAYGGSSGSMILNTSGYLVGMIHSGRTDIPIVTFGPSFEILKNFLLSNLKT